MNQGRLLNQKLKRKFPEKTMQWHCCPRSTMQWLQLNMGSLCFRFGTAKCIVYTYHPVYPRLSPIMSSEATTHAAHGLTPEQFELCMQCSDRWKNPASEDGWVLSHNAIRQDLRDFDAVLTTLCAQQSPLTAWQLSTVTKYWNCIEHQVTHHHDDEERLFMPLMETRFQVPPKMGADHRVRVPPTLVFPLWNEVFIVVMWFTYCSNCWSLCVVCGRQWRAWPRRATPRLWLRFVPPLTQ